MAKTLGNLRTGVRVYLDESNQADFLDTEVLREINYAFHDVVSEVMEVNEDYYNTTTPKFISTVANQQEYSLDVTLIKIRRVEINYTPANVNSQAIRAIAIGIDELPRRLGDTNSGGGGMFDCGYYINGSQAGQKIGFVPIPTATATNNVSVWGVALPADLVNDSDAVDIPYVDRFAKLIEILAASRLLEKGQQAEGVAEQMYKTYINECLRMKTFLKERKSDGPDMIIDILMEDIAFDIPL